MLCGSLLPTRAAASFPTVAARPFGPTLVRSHAHWAVTHRRWATKPPRPGSSDATRPSHATARAAFEVTLPSSRLRRRHGRASPADGSAHLLWDQREDWPTYRGISRPLTVGFLPVLGVDLAHLMWGLTPLTPPAGTSQRPPQPPGTPQQRRHGVHATARTSGPQRCPQCYVAVNQRRGQKDVGTRENWVFAVSLYVGSRWPLTPARCGPSSPKTPARCGPFAL